MDTRDYTFQGLQSSNFPKLHARFLHLPPAFVRYQSTAASGSQLIRNCPRILYLHLHKLQVTKKLTRDLHICQELSISNKEGHAGPS
ncbi:hypothetical protein SRHO_G00206420 [Serrasalmus rhombeus]